eukprot:scaffold1390_cov249-Pinguiococcus_pyrenoidosus.AAC.21
MVQLRSTPPLVEALCSDATGTDLVRSLRGILLPSSSSLPGHSGESVMLRREKDLAVTHQLLRRSVRPRLELLPVLLPGLLQQPQPSEKPLMLPAAVLGVGNGALDVLPQLLPCRIQLVSALAQLVAQRVPLSQQQLHLRQRGAGRGPRGRQDRVSLVSLRTQSFFQPDATPVCEQDLTVGGHLGVEAHGAEHLDGMLSQLLCSGGVALVCRRLETLEALAQYLELLREALELGGSAVVGVLVLHARLVAHALAARREQQRAQALVEVAAQRVHRGDERGEGTAAERVLQQPCELGVAEGHMRFLRLRQRRRRRLCRRVRLRLCLRLCLQRHQHFSQRCEGCIDVHGLFRAPADALALLQALAAGQAPPHQLQGVGSAGDRHQAQVLHEHLAGVVLVDLQAPQRVHVPQQRGPRGRGGEGGGLGGLQPLRDGGRALGQVDDAEALGHGGAAGGAAQVADHVAVHFQEAAALPARAALGRDAALPRRTWCRSCRSRSGRRRSSRLDSRRTRRPARGAAPARTAPPATHRSRTRRRTRRRGRRSCALPGRAAPACGRRPRKGAAAALPPRSARRLAVARARTP